MVMESVNDRTVPSSTFVHGGTGEPSLRTPRERIAHVITLDDLFDA